MLRKSFRFFYVAAILCAGCAHKAVMYQKASGLSEGESGQAHNAYYVPLARASFGIAAGGGGGDAGKVFAAARFVAVRHKLEIVEPSLGLPKSIEVDMLPNVLPHTLHVRFLLRT